MKRYFTLLITLLFANLLFSQNNEDYNIKQITELKISEEIGQLRAVPVNLGKEKKAICAMYSEDAEIDPYIGMFFFPKHTLKLIMFDVKGNVL